MSTKCNTVTVSIIGDGSPRKVENVPWYAGITALNAMVMADAMTEPAGAHGSLAYKKENDFGFRVSYSSRYGAFVDQVGDTANRSDRYWILYVYKAGAPDPQPSEHGVSEALILESGTGQTFVVEWRFEEASEHPVSRRAAELTKSTAK